MTLRLDAVAAARVAALWSRLACRALSDLALLNYQPHVTLAVLPDDVIGLAECVARVSAGWHALPVRLAAVGVFPGPPAVVWLALVPDATLLAWQHALCAALPAGVLHPHYRPGAWMAHVTLAEDLTQAGLAEAVSCVAEDWKPFDGRLVQVDLVRFRPVSMVWQGRLPDAEGPVPLGFLAK